MAWTAYKVVLHLLTPLHIGARKLGNVQYTRPYVTGKALWGALTARLTRDVAALGGDYIKVGSQVNEELAFSYFYPASGEQVDLWPWGDKADEFAWRYLGTYASTALNYTQSAAAEGSLHETEFIAPRTRNGQPVNLIGYIFAQAGCNLKWRDMLSRLQLGGERTYGWGRVAKAKVESAGDLLFEHWQIELTKNRPVLTATDKDAPLFAHARTDGLQAQGRIEPLVGRQTSDSGKHGEAPREAEICWAPGAHISADTRITIGAMGIWKSA